LPPGGVPGSGCALLKCSDCAASGAARPGLARWFRGGRASDRSLKHRHRSSASPRSAGKVRPGRSNEAIQAASRLRPNLAAAEASRTASRTAAPDGRSPCRRSAYDAWLMGGPLGSFGRASARDLPREFREGLRRAQPNQLPGPEARRGVLPGMAAQLVRSKPTCRRTSRKAEQLGAGGRRGLLARRLGRGSLEWSELGRPRRCSEQGVSEAKAGVEDDVEHIRQHHNNRGLCRARRTAFTLCCAYNTCNIILYYYIVYYVVSIKEYHDNHTNTSAHRGTLLVSCEPRRVYRAAQTLPQAPPAAL